MNDRVRRTILFIFSILVIIGFAFAFNYNQNANVNRKLFEKEMAVRFDMEEMVSKLRSEKMDLITALKNKNLEILKKEELAADFNQTIADQKEVIENLRLELKGMTLLKRQLEKSLKEELSQDQEWR